MKYIKLFEDINFDDWDEEESAPTVINDIKKVIEEIVDSRDNYSYDYRKINLNNHPLMEDVLIHRIYPYSIDTDKILFQCEIHEHKDGYFTYFLIERNKFTEFKTDKKEEYIEKLKEYIKN